MLLKFLGEAGKDVPIRRAATVSAPLDLSHTCRTLMRWRNVLYHRYILTHLKRGCTAPGARLTEAERSAILGSGSLWQFDHEFTAKRNGFEGADSYYEANSARRYLQGIEVEESTSFFERVSGKIAVETLLPSWLIFSDGFKTSSFRLASARA